MMTAELLSRARAGDGEAFRELTGPHRRELQVHCYRMLGSFADAEEPVQETMLAAWQGIGGFTEERASLRTWLYKIATNRCLNARRAASRRPAREWDVSQFEPLVPTPRDEAVWLQPFPDALLEGAVDVPPGPEACYEQTEAISLAFVAALQVLPPRQVAVLILRDLARRKHLQGGNEGQRDGFGLLVAGLRPGRHVDGTLEEGVRKRLQPDGLVARRRHERFELRHVPLPGRAPARCAARVEAPVGGDLLQPRAQRGAFLSEPADALPGGQHRLLDGVLGVGEGAARPG